MTPELAWSLGLVLGVALGIPVGWLLSRDGTISVILDAILPADDRGQ
jgi:hypothetical protein